MATARPRVLIVDDHPSFRRAAREVLAARGYAVVGEAACTATARILVEHLDPDLVVIDVCLGEENGFDLARALTFEDPSLPVLMVSANAELAGPELLSGSGARGFVPKLELATADLLWF